MHFFLWAHESLLCRIACTLWVHALAPQCFSVLYLCQLCFFFFFFLFFFFFFFFLHTVLCATDGIDGEDVSMFCNPAYVAIEFSHQCKPEETALSFHQSILPETLLKLCLIAACNCWSWKDGEWNHSMGSPMDGTPPQSEDQWRSSNSIGLRSVGESGSSDSPCCDYTHHPFMINWDIV